MFKCHPQCSTPVLIQGSTTLGELVIPAGSLDYGLYQIELTVAMTFSSRLVALAVTFVTIIPSPITVNLVQLGSSMITHGQQQTLILDPGSYSIDPDFVSFNASVGASPHPPFTRTAVSALELELHVSMPYRQCITIRERRRSNQSVVFGQ